VLQRINPNIFPHVPALLRCEHDIRFLTDYLQGDTTYYKIARPSHNLDRTRVQFALLRSMEA
jgi:hypothetical protein